MSASPARSDPDEAAAASTESAATASGGHPERSKGSMQLAPPPAVPAVQLTRRPADDRLSPGDSRHSWTSAFGRACGVLLDTIVRWLALSRINRKRRCL